MTGFALPLDDLPLVLADRREVVQRVHLRAGKREVQFHYWQRPALLPVHWEGSVQLLPWGSSDRRGPLPVGGWIDAAAVERGQFGAGAMEAVEIPAVMGFHAGTWYLILEGVRGVVLNGSRGPVVYVLTRPATSYYRNMTEQSPTMPMLVGQVI